jgi:[acyl-carrier-protein] S-malonyltransferase
MKIAFCFPGQGSQQLGMGRDVADAFPDSRAIFDEASEITGLDLARLCSEGPLETLTETEIQQPALVTASLACLRAVEGRGVRPDAVVGHSVGEYSALVACGALTAANGLALVRERGLATAAAARARPGAMAAVMGLADEVVEELCAEIGEVWPANYNCPGQIVISGTESAVERLIERAKERGARRIVMLRVTGGFHSPLVAPAADRLRPLLERTTFLDPAVPFLSTVTAQPEVGARLPALLLEQLAAPVRFTRAVGALVRMGVRMFVEVGPGQVLAGLIRRCDPSVTAISVGDCGSLAKLEEVLTAVR